jgi:hypothetical protein
MHCATFCVTQAMNTDTQWGVIGHSSGAWVAQGAIGVGGQCGVTGHSSGA